MVHGYNKAPRRCNMANTLALKVNRPYKTTVDGNEVNKNRWVQIGIQTPNKKVGFTQHFDVLPLVVNGQVEKVMAFPIERKEDSNEAI